MNIDVRTGVFEDKKNQIGTISSQLLQYLRNAVDFHLTWTITMNGSTPINKRWVVLPMWKLWQSSEARPHGNHILLHIGIEEPWLFSKAKRWEEGGV